MARSDLFLKVTGARTGAIEGESQDKHFRNQIDVVDWSWGMTSPSAIGGQRSGRTLLGDLKIVKRADKASTSLMNVMTNNETMTVELSVRKAGGRSALPYYVVKLTSARIVAIEVASDFDRDGAPTLTERISLTYTMIAIDYTVQDETGGSLSGTSFLGTVSPV